MALPLLIWLVILIITLIALVKGADWFTKGAEEVGVKLKMPPFVVGVLIVSIGTSLPELASSIAAVLRGSSDIVLGNVVGSNIANTLFVLGLGAILAGGLSTKWKMEKVDMPFLFGATFLLILTAIDGTFTWPEAILMLVCFGVYIHYILSMRKKDKIDPHVAFQGWKSAGLLFIGLVLVVGGAKYLIDSVVVLSSALGISTAIIGASVVAFGTSLPEAMVTVVAAMKGRKEIAFGNIIGSNIFNILFIMGIAGIVGPLTIDSKMLTFGLPVLVGATFMLWFTTQDRKISKWEGAMLLVLYGFFIVKLFV